MEMQGRLCMFLSLYEEAAGYFKRPAMLYSPACQSYVDSCRLVDINTEHHVYALAYMVHPSA